MDFFAHQDNARRLTRRLVLLLALAVIAILVTVNLVVAIALDPSPVTLAVTTVITLLVIFGGSLYRIVSLSDGGTAVAEMMGARRVVPSTGDFEEKRLVNIVEEMALAAGISVPVVYVMDRESGINAFAAGYSPNEAVVAVTRGALKQLNRDELQGVVAHEFSHILNGDMRLNIRMLGLLHGILLIGLIGQHIMDGTRGSTRNRDGGSIFFLGLGLFAIGAIGVLFARVIKASVSRQREYLADASAVQFTRNPEGIGGALVKIGRQGATIESQHAEELSHMFLGAGTRRTVAGWFATHPPIDERVTRIIGPGRAIGLERAETAPAADDWGRHAQVSRIATNAAAVVASVGNPDPRHVRFARGLLDGLPAELRAAIATEDGAKAAVFALLLAEDAHRMKQLEILLNADEHRSAELARAFAGPLRALGERARLPIIELALPSLKALPLEERRLMLALVRALALADERISSIEFVIAAILDRQLDDDVERKQRIKYPKIAAAAEHAALVVSMFVRTASGGSLLFDRLMHGLGIEGARLTAPSALGLDRVEAALIELKQLAPLEKPKLIKACLEAVLEDGRIAVSEAELMRAVCAMLDSPLPPILEERQ